MGKIKEFEILFVGDKNVFKPGDMIEGEVKIVMKEEKRNIAGEY